MADKAAFSDNTNSPAAVKARLQAFVKFFTYALYLAGLGVLVGLLLKFLHLSGEHLVFILAIAVFTLLLFLQTGLSFFYVFAHIKLAFLGAFSSLAVGLGCITMAFLFETWWGSHILLFLTLPLLLLSFSFLVYYVVTSRHRFSSQHRHRARRRFLYYNIVGPFLFLLVLWLIYLVHQQVSPNLREERDIKRQQEGVQQI